MSKERKFKELRQKAELLLKEKKLLKPENFYNDIEKLVEELNIHQIELEMQNRELQETTQALTREQNRYKELYMNAPVAYFTLNQTGNIIELNQAAADLLNVPIQAFRYTSIFPYLEKESKSHFTHFFKTVFNSEETHYGDIVFKDNDDKPVFANLSAKSYFDKHMNQSLVRCTVSDLSRIKRYEEQIQTQKKLLESENRMRHLFNKNGVPMLLINPETGQIEDSNSAAAEFYGYGIEKLKLMNIAHLNRLPAEEIAKEMENAKKTGKKYFNFKHKLKNGQVRDVEVYSSAIPFGETTKLFSIIHDITNRKKAADENEQLTIELNSTIEELNTTNDELNNTNAELNAINDELNSINATIEHERRQFLSILDSIPELIYVADFDTYELVFINKTLKNNIGRDITGEKCFEVLQGKTEACDFCTNKYIKTNNAPYIWEYHNPIIEKDFYVMDRKIKWSDNKEVRFELAIDITEQKQTEKQLRQSEEKYRLITENASDVIWILNLSQKKFTYISPSVYSLRGYTPEEAMQQDISQSLTPESAKFVLESIAEIMPKFLANPTEESKKIHRHELRQTCKDGSVIWIETTTRYQFNTNNEVEVIGISRNIEDRKKQQQRIETHLHYVQNIADFSNTLLLGQANAVQKSLNYILKAAQCSRVYIFKNFIDTQNRLSIKQTHEVCAPGIKPEIDNPDLQHLIYEEDGFLRWKDLFIKGKVINEIVANMPKSERLILENQSIKSILTIPIFVHQKWYGFIGFDDTVSERQWNNEDVDLLRTAAEILGLYLQNKKDKQQIITQNNILIKQRTKLKEALETKEVLLKEVHHRVKNNLQTISSLLYRQQTLAKDPKIANALRDSMNRVSTMALIHQFIYKSADLKNINMKNYIHDLVSKLASTYNQHRQNIVLNINIEEIFFDIEKTIPVALIVNEVLSNIYKYAFAEKEDGTILVALTKTADEKNKLIISDNGIGFPDNFEPQKSKSLGMYLIKNFAKRQLKGTIQITSNPNAGVKFEIIFL